MLAGRDEGGYETRVSLPPEEVKPNLTPRKKEYGNGEIPEQDMETCYDVLRELSRRASRGKLNTLADRFYSVAGAVSTWGKSLSLPLSNKEAKDEDGTAQGDHTTPVEASPDQKEKD